MKTISSSGHTPHLQDSCFSGFCAHHSTSRRLHFVRTSQSLAKAIEEIIKTYTEEFDVNQMANFSQQRKLGLSHEIALTDGTIYKVELCLEQGIPFESRYGEDERLNCPGTHPMLLCTLTPS